MDCRRELRSYPAFPAKILDSGDGLSLNSDCTIVAMDLCGGTLASGRMLNSTVRTPLGNSRGFAGASKDVDPLVSRARHGRLRKHLPLL